MATSKQMHACGHAGSAPLADGGRSKARLAEYRAELNFQEAMDGWAHLKIMLDGWIFAGEMSIHPSQRLVHS